MNGRTVVIIDDVLDKGITFDDTWLVGMGMDDARAADEGYRWLEAIWEINR